MRRITRIVLHHSLTRDGQTVSWDAIRRYHVERRGWHDIGYQLGLELIGESYEVLWGRSWRQLGAHAIGANGDSLGFCWVGDYTEMPPPDGMIERGVSVLADLCATFGLRPETAIVGHRDVSPNRACPGAAFPLERIRAMVSGRPL